MLRINAQGLGMGVMAMNMAHWTGGRADEERIGGGGKERESVCETPTTSAHLNSWKSDAPASLDLH